MMTSAKRDRMRAIATHDGKIAAIAMDQRTSLRRMLAAAAGLPEADVPNARLGEFKTCVTAALSPHGSAILLDPEYGLDAAGSTARGCGLLLTYESDGFDNPRPHRMLALMPRYSVARLKKLGADAIKVLLSYTPEDDEAANDEKRAWIERIGSECDAQDLPFLLEPVVYDPAGADPRGLDFARRKPELVVRTMEEFSRPVYKVDVLKVEFPVNLTFVEGSRAYGGIRAFSMREALNWYRTADTAAGCPYIYLSAGVGIDEFVGSLELAAESGVRYSGVLCGRATWQEGIPAYVRGGAAALNEWLLTAGVANVRRISECLQSAVSWEARA